MPWFLMFFFCGKDAAAPRVPQLLVSFFCGRNAAAPRVLQKYTFFLSWFMDAPAFKTT